MTKTLPNIPQDNTSSALYGEDRLAIRLSLLALAGIVAAIGVGLLGYVGIGLFWAVFFSSVMLIATAVVLIGAARSLENNAEHSTDLQIIEEALGTILQPSLVTNVSGTILSQNACSRDELGGHCIHLKDLLKKKSWEKVQSAISAYSGGTIALKVELQGQSELYALELKRVAGLFIWTFDRQRNSAGMAAESLKDVEWLEPAMSLMGFGLLVTDDQNKITYSSSKICQWLQIDEKERDTRDLKISVARDKLSKGSQYTISVKPLVFPFGGQAGEDQGELVILSRSEDIVSSDRPSVSHQGHKYNIDVLLDNAPIAVAMVDKEGAIIEFSQPLDTFMGEKARVGNDIKLLAAADDRARLEHAIRWVAETGAEARPIDVGLAQSSERLGQISFASMQTDEGRRVLIYVIDRTQEKSLERQFVQAQKMQAVGQLAGGVAHDFNNLLTAILGFSDMLLSRHNASDQSFSDIMQIKQNANRAANLVRQLLAFSRQQTMRPRTLWLTEVMSEISNLLRRLIGERIELRIKHGRDLKPIRVDPGQLDQVIINLAVNARDAMPDGGFLDIETSLIAQGDALLERYSVVEDNDYVLLRIKDSGTGIPEDIRGKIFEPFFTTKEVGQGTGLGLATVYGIIKQTGGYVFVNSKEGEGTEFLLLLPAMTVETEREEKSVEAASASDLSGKGVVLLVEDEEPVRLLSSRALKARGYDVHEAEHGEAALRLLEENPDLIPSLLISDVVMPNMDGPALLAELRTRWPVLPVIFISGYAEDVVRKSLEEESVHFLQKPFSLKDISALAKSVLS